MGVHIEDKDHSLYRTESECDNWEMPRMAREMFYAQLDALFAETQAFTHIETGSLKASGKIHTSYDPVRHTLEGEITYGGAAPGGVHDPVRYSVYEAARGPEHNPLTPVYAAEPSLEAIFSDSDIMFKGSLG